MAAILDYDLPLLADLGPEDLAGLTLRPQILQLAPWQTVFEQTDTDCNLCFLLSGALLAIHWTEDGREIIFTRFQPGEHFGELSALDGQARSLAVVARTAARVLVLPQDQFLALIERSPVIRDRLFRSLTSRIRQLTRRNLELVTQSVGQRLRSYLLSLAYERGQLHPGAVIEDMPTHADIAASIGANREIVSRTLSQMQREGMIRTGRKRLELCDPDALAAEGD